MCRDPKLDKLNVYIRCLHKILLLDGLCQQSFLFEWEDGVERRGAGMRVTNSNCHQSVRLFTARLLSNHKSQFSKDMFVTCY